MIILLEGPDGVGKTSLGQAFVNDCIQNKRTCFYFHCTNKSEKKSADEDYSLFLENLKSWKSLDYDVIIDRAWISNIVYTSVYEPTKKHISSDLAKKLFDIVDEVIICLPENKSDYIQHFKSLSSQREEAYIDDMDKIYELFNTFAKVYTRYDILENNKNKTKEFVNIIKEKINVKA